jgi:hypothetical protein
MRQAFERASEARISKQAHRVLEAVVGETVGYSRFEDRISSARIAKVARVHPQDAKKILRMLRDLKIIVYIGGCGRGNLSTVGLPRAAEKEGQLTPVSADQREGDSAEKGRRFEVKREGDGAFPPEESSEKTAEEVAGVDPLIIEIKEIGYVSPSQIADVRQAASESLAGVEREWKKACTSGATRPVGIFLAAIKQGDHRIVPLTDDERRLAHLQRRMQRMDDERREREASA